MRRLTIRPARGADLLGRERERSLLPPALDHRGEPDRRSAGRAGERGVDGEQERLAGLGERERRRSVLSERDRAARFKENVHQAQIVKPALRQGVDHVAQRNGARRRVEDLDLIFAEACFAAARVRPDHLPDAGAAVGARHAPAHGEEDAGERRRRLDGRRFAGRFRGRGGRAGGYSQQERCRADPKGGPGGARPTQPACGGVLHNVPPRQNRKARPRLNRFSSASVSSFQCSKSPLKAILSIGR